MERLEPPTSALAPRPTPTVADAPTPLVISCQRAALGTFFRRENVRDQNAARRRADVEAELAYSSEITLMAPSFGGVSALELLGRGDDQPEAARYLAAQLSDLYVLLRGCGRGQPEQTCQSSDENKRTTCHDDSPMA